MIKLNRPRFAFRLDSSLQFNAFYTLWRVEHTRVADSEMFWIKENFSTFWKPCRSKNHSFYSNSKKVNFLFKKYLKIQNKTGLLDSPLIHLFSLFHEISDEWSHDLSSVEIANWKNAIKLLLLLCIMNTYKQTIIFFS